jgi:hypothetical protein
LEIFTFARLSKYLENLARRSRGYAPPPQRIQEPRQSMRANGTEPGAERPVDLTSSHVMCPNERIVAMKAAALAFSAAALSFAMSAAAAPVQNPGQSPAQTRDRPGQSYDQSVGGTTSIKPQEQQAELGSGREHDRYCQGLKQRAQELRDNASRSKDHGDFAHARDQLDQINDRLEHDCSR